MNSLEGVYCDSWTSERNYGKRKASLAVKYGNTAVRFYEKKNEVQNIMYDWLSYGQINNDRQMDAKRTKIQAEQTKLEEEFVRMKKEFEQT